VQASIRERNLFGDARDLRASVLFGTRSSSFHIGYLDRYWRGTDMSLDWELYCDRYFRREYGERTYGTSLEFGKPLSEYVKAYLRFRLEDVNFFDEDDDIRARLDSYPLAAVRFRIVEDRLNDTWWPTRGFTRSAGVELGYADGLLAKFSTDFSYYNNFYKDFVYSISGFAGLIPYDADKVGITERFFLGGANDLRGFAYRGAGPMDKGDHEMAIGGSTKLLLKNEIRYPIYDELKGLIFLDMGMLDETVGLDKPRVSVGTGFRLKISFVRIYVDFAKALVKEHRDNTQIFHFRLGANF
jgi:outer membrane protein insertion porin family